MGTNIQVSDVVWQELNSRKKPGESFDDVLRRMLSVEETEEKSAQDGTETSEQSTPETDAVDADIRTRMEEQLAELDVPGRPDRVERTRRDAIVYGWERLREEGEMRPRDLADDIFGQFFDDPDLNYSTASGRHAGYQMWDNCVRSILQELPGIYPGTTWEFRKE